MTDENRSGYLGPGDLVPRPDPTVLTTAAVDRALSSYREIVDTRLGGMDKAIGLVAESNTRRLAAEREYLTGQINTLSALITALDRRVSEQFNGQQTALAAALASQEKAVAAALAAAEKAVSAALAAAEKAVDLRQTSAEREFHEHLDQYRHEVEFAFAASDRAITKAETATEKRFEGVNEFRAQLTDQASTFMPRAEAEVTVTRVNERMAELSATAASHLPRTEYNSAHERLVEQVRELNDRVTKSEGKGMGYNASWIIVLGIIAAVGTLVSLYVAFKGG